MALHYIWKHGNVLKASSLSEMMAIFFERVLNMVRTVKQVSASSADEMMRRLLFCIASNVKIMLPRTIYAVMKKRLLHCREMIFFAKRSVKNLFR